VLRVCVDKYIYTASSVQIYGLGVLIYEKGYFEFKGRGFDLDPRVDNLLARVRAYNTYPFTKTLFTKNLFIGVLRALLSQGVQKPLVYKNTVEVYKNTVWGVQKYGFFYVAIFGGEVYKNTGNFSTSHFI